MEEKSGERAAPTVIVSHDEDGGLTGYFNDGRKRIDIVVVFNDDNSEVIKKTRIYFLMNVIQFGLEAEVEPGKMPEHRNLIFVKLHAPDAIIEEFGLYLNEKSLFKDSHLEFVNPIVNILGVSNERELIKIVRKQYPGPDNYSTLERSNIVYKILLRLPFGKYRNHFGITTLIDNNIIKDVYALHDGPYFILPRQRLADINARQVLFFEWLGIINVWKLQPIHMIHEYFGKRISFYFAFYEYFNFMLIIPLIVGVFKIYSLYKNRKHVGPYEDIKNGPCSSWKWDFVCPECRNVSLCPILKENAYCDELELLAIIDKETTYRFGHFIVIWGILFLLPWRYGERYLTWIWEETKSYTKELVRPEYEEKKMTSNKEKWPENQSRNLSSTLLRIFIYISTAIFLSLWALLLFRLSMLIWYYPRWKRLHAPQKLYAYKNDENENLAVGAGIYTIIVYPLKMVFSTLAQKLTDCENNERFLIYDRSIALKMYAGCFIGTFCILITYTYIGGLFKYHGLYEAEELSHMMYGYAMMNSGLGSAFDDICITVAVITILEHVIFRIPGFFFKHKTDYPVGFNNTVPCWEREYKLKPITEFFVHKRYCALAIQFALLTCYSMMFPLAPLFIFIINIWDLRDTARQLLLEYRRPLLINKSGPEFWKFLIFITALYAPMSNTAIIIFQSHAFAKKHFTTTRYDGKFDVVAEVDYKLTSLKSYYYSGNDFQKMRHRLEKDHYVTEKCKQLEIDDFRTTLVPAILIELLIRYIILATLIGIVLGFFLFYVIPKTSNSLEEVIKKEERIKNKYQTQRVLLNNLSFINNLPPT